MKIKTSVSLHEDTVKKLDKAGELEERSRSYFIEKMAELLAAAAGRGEKLGDTLERIAQELDRKGGKPK